MFLYHKYKNDPEPTTEVKNNVLKINKFDVVESLVSSLEPNNSEYFYKISDILKELVPFFYELPE